MNSRMMRKNAVIAAASAVLAFASSSGAQRGASPEPAATPQATAAIDLTGYWVSVVFEDWKYRMVTPNAGEYGGVPLNPEGRRLADAWDPANDEAAGEECRAYGAPAIMRVPGRLHITWPDPTTLQIDTDAGMQSRLFHFSPQAPEGGDSWQGRSHAEWQYAGGRGGPGSLKVVTTGMRPGYLRKNGVPYSADAVVTEYYDLNAAPNGDQWLVVTTIVEDPAYLSGPFVTSTDFKKLDDASGWNPTPCSAR